MLGAESSRANLTRYVIGSREPLEQMAKDQTITYLWFPCAEGCELIQFRLPLALSVINILLLEVFEVFLIFVPPTQLMKILKRAAPTQAFSIS